ncbi:MAG TPA: hypothetical protein VJ044_11300, partial [Candidatus Hodarchaeales archaeon]|nr:hypothetical protein [Candidatus Hodarchaeales archaeon]
LLESPVRIREAESELIRLANIQKMERDQIAKIEAGFKTEIGMNKNLKNEAERKATLELSLKDHKEYQELQLHLPEIELAVAKAQTELGFHRNTFQAYLAIAGMLADAEAK